jgi:hypothetical protein
MVYVAASKFARSATIGPVGKQLIVAGFLAAVLGLASCGTASPRPREQPRRENVRTPAHAAALAEVLVEADGADQAEVITKTCDLGFSTGCADGLDMAFQLSTATITNHCIGAITAEMLASFAAEVGHDTEKITERARIFCEGKPVPPTKSSYAEDLLLVTQKCEGNRLCTLTLQTAFKRCYMAGMMETLQAEIEKTLTSMLAICEDFHAESPKCQNDARSAMSELRRLALKISGGRQAGR